MATTIEPQTLTITISEAITLNGQTINSSNELKIESIANIDKRIVPIGFSAEQVILNLAAAYAAGTFTRANLKYIRITNKDGANFMRLRVSKTTGVTFDVKLDPGKSFILSNSSINANTNAGAFSAFADVDTIIGQADTAIVNIEYFVASTA
jgi:hypothetical protein